MRSPVVGITIIGSIVMESAIFLQIGLSARMYARKYHARRSVQNRQRRCVRAASWGAKISPNVVEFESVHQRSLMGAAWASGET